VRQLLPHPEDDVEPEAVYGSVARAPVNGRPWVLSDFVCSVDGAATDDGRSRGLSGPGDRKVFHALRHLADVILVGASTVRVEGYGAARADEGVRAARLRRGQPPVPPIAVCTQSLQLDWSSPFFADAEARPVVITSSSADAEARERAAEVADVVVAGAERVDLARALAELGAAGHRIVLTEGGPTLHAELAAAGLLDELCLTLAPRLVGGDGLRITNGPSFEPPRELRLAHVLEEDGFLFLRYERA